MSHIPLSVAELAVLSGSLVVLAFVGGWAYCGRHTHKAHKELGLLLASKEEHLQFIFNSVPIGISMYGIGRDDSRVWHINDRHLEISGIIRIGQVLVNLLGNAIKFTEKGTVTLHVGLPDGGDGSRVRICVSDTGIGIAPEMMPKLFQAYCQGDASVSRNFGGTGLGLAIVKGLVELMGSSIHVESRLGEGSTFYFDIPVNAADAGPPTGLQDRAPATA